MVAKKSLAAKVLADAHRQTRNRLVAFEAGLSESRKGEQSRRVSVAERHQLFDAEIAAVLKVVSHKYVYLDTAQLLLQSRPSPAILAGIQVRSTAPICVRRTRLSDWPFRIVLQKPSRELLSFIQGRIPANMVNRFDIAVDLAVPNVAAARRLQGFFDKHIIQPWRGKRTSTTVDHTEYWAGAWQRRNIAVYSDRPSKISGGPALHIELRFYSTHVCRGCGVSTLSDLIDYHPRHAILRYCRIALLDWHKAEQELDRYVGSNLLQHNRRKRPRHIARREMMQRDYCSLAFLLGEEDPGFAPLALRNASMQDLIDRILPRLRLAGADIRRAIISRPPDQLLRRATFEAPLND